MTFRTKTTTANFLVTTKCEQEVSRRLLKRKAVSIASNIEAYFPSINVTNNSNVLQNLRPKQALRILTYFLSHLTQSLATKRERKMIKQATEILMLTTTK